MIPTNNWASQTIKFWANDFYSVTAGLLEETISSFYNENM